MDLDRGAVPPVREGADEDHVLGLHRKIRDVGEGDAFAGFGIAGQRDDLVVFAARRKAPDFGILYGVFIAPAAGQGHEISDGVARAEFQGAFPDEGTVEGDLVPSEVDVDPVAHAQVGIETQIAGRQEHGQVHGICGGVAVGHQDGAPGGGAVGQLPHPGDGLAALGLLDRASPQLVEEAAGSFDQFG